MTCVDKINTLNLSDVNRSYLNLSDLNLSSPHNCFIDSNVLSPNSDSLLSPNSDSLLSPNSDISNFDLLSPNSDITGFSSNLNFYECFYCNYISINSIDILNHISDHSKLYKCYCNFECRDPITFLQHKINHKIVNPFGCFKCKYSCKNLRDLRKHLQIHFNPKTHSRSFSETISCKYKDCKYITNRSFDLKRHTKSHKNNRALKHTDDIILHKCNFFDCKKTFKKANNLDIHFIKHL